VYGPGIFYYSPTITQNSYVGEVAEADTPWQIYRRVGREIRNTSVTGPSGELGDGILTPDNRNVYEAVNKEAADDDSTGHSLVVTDTDIYRAPPIALVQCEEMMTISRGERMRPIWQPIWH
jgi:hypothetical protein